MNSARPILSSFLAMALLSGVFGCKPREFEVPELHEQPVLTKVVRKDFTETAPGYGIYSGGFVQVNVEAEDAPNIRVGQIAQARIIPGRISIPCRVSRILKRVSAETWQGIAWLRPVHSGSQNAGLQEGDFVYATIVTRVLHGALAIPREGAFIKDGKTWAIEEVIDEGKTDFKAVPLQVGLMTDGEAEILEGLSEGQTIAIGGGIGYLYPDFKAASGDD